VCRRGTLRLAVLAVFILLEAITGIVASVRRVETLAGVSSCMSMALSEFLERREGRVGAGANDMVGKYDQPFA
jgi:hypothetical protein